MPNRTEVVYERPKIQINMNLNAETMLISYNTSYINELEIFLWYSLRPSTPPYDIDQA